MRTYFNRWVTKPTPADRKFIPRTAEVGIAEGNTIIFYLVKNMGAHYHVLIFRFRRRLHCT